MADPMDTLQTLGLSEVEARLYLSLLPRPPLTGYELAREAGVMRPNVYPALERLERRGAVMRRPMEGGGVRYAAVPYERFLHRLEDEHGKALKEARAALSEVRAAEPVSDGPISAKGYANLLANARRLCAEAGRSLLLAAAPAEAAALHEPVAQAEERGIVVGTVCLTACPEPCGYCRGTLVRSGFLTAAEQGRWLFLLRDDEELLIGEITRDGEAQVTLTWQRPFLAAAAGLFAHAAALAARGEPPGPVPGSAQFLSTSELR